MNPTDVGNLVSALRDGGENAYHTLIESHDAIVPQLIEHYTNANDGELRARIVEVIWQHRVPTTVSFLASALNDEHPEVWKQAIDGLVTIGGDHSVGALKTLLGQIKYDDARSPWIAEAIDQIES
ncbi:MAG TPA: HEAT repeat domain-containing protein [Pirellulaceae bacterium]|nr:HEAT repeat domain-containing protein [Pirellulaceae bacterium]HMO93849.1 HEAT repeat domain-containing protein [Pirellulaceae bacterium]